MNQKPLSYESSKCVIQYMEANLRIQLAQCAPSIRNAEKSTPFIIENLFLEPLRTKINGTTYQLGIYRTIKKGCLLKCFQKENDQGGAQYDLDRFEKPKYSFEEVVLPDDVAIQYYTKEQKVQPQLEVLEPALNRLMGEKRRKGGKKNDESINRQIERYQALIIPLRLRKDNAKSPYNNYMQLTTISPNGDKTIERVKYRKKIYKTMKCLNSKIFGGRRNNIHIKCIQFLSHGGIFRFPEGLKMKIHKLKVESSMTKILNGLETIIELPLKTIEIKHKWRFYISGDYPNHQILNTARNLIIVNRSNELSWINKLPKLSNRKVHFEYGCIGKDEYIYFVKELLVNGHSIGNRYYFKVLEWGLNNEVTPFIQEFPNGKMTILKGIRCTTIPMSNSSELNICIFEDGTIKNRKQTHKSFIVKMKIMPAGSAIPLASDLEKLEIT